MDIKIANGEGMYMSVRNEKGWPGEDRVRGIAVQMETMLRAE